MSVSGTIETTDVGATRPQRGMTRQEAGTTDHGMGVEEHRATPTADNRLQLTARMAKTRVRMITKRRNKAKKKTTRKRPWRRCWASEALERQETSTLTATTTSAELT